MGAAPSTGMGNKGGDYLKHGVLRSISRAADFVVIHWPRKVNSSLNCVQPALHQLRYWLGKCVWLVLILTRHCVGRFMKHPISIAGDEGWVSDLRGSRAGRRHWPEKKPSASLSQREAVTVALRFARIFFPMKSLSGITAHFLSFPNVVRAWRHECDNVEGSSS